MEQVMQALFQAEGTVNTTWKQQWGREGREGTWTRRKAREERAGASPQGHGGEPLAFTLGCWSRGRVAPGAAGRQTS